MSNENQHWVPKLLIKNFAGSDGRVFCLNIQTDAVTKPPPKHAAAAIGFNDFVVNGKAISYEDKLEKIETAAAPILKQIITSRSAAGLTTEQRGRVADFIAAQSFRTKAFHEGLGLQSSRQAFGPLFAQLWRSAFLLSAEVLRRKWLTLSIEHEDVFYLGDHPVVLQHTEAPASPMELGFDIKGVEAFLPLSPKSALYMPCLSTSREIISGYENARRMPQLIEWAKRRGTSSPLDEKQALDLAERVRKNSAQLYAALTKGLALIAEPANVENLNYLQCMYASSAIYSNCRNFAFAQMVLARSPQYRNAVRVRLAEFGESPGSAAPK